MTSIWENMFGSLFPSIVASRKKSKLGEISQSSRFALKRVQKCWVDSLPPWVYPFRRVWFFGGELTNFVRGPTHPKRPPRLPWKSKKDPFFGWSAEPKRPPCFGGRLDLQGIWVSSFNNSRVGPIFWNSRVLDFRKTLEVSHHSTRGQTSHLDDKPFTWKMVKLVKPTGLKDGGQGLPGCLYVFFVCSSNVGELSIKIHIYK